MAARQILRMTVAIGLALAGRSVAAQTSSKSVVHMVSATVQPRVKVDVSRMSTATPTVAGVSMTVNSSQAWVLSIGTSAPNSSSSTLQWSSDNGTAFSPMSSDQATVASGKRSAATANVLFRGISRSQAGPDSSNAPVMLTITTP